MVRTNHAPYRRFIFLLIMFCRLFETRAMTLYRQLLITTGVHSIYFRKWYLKQLIILFQQMIGCLVCVTIFVTVRTETCTGCCKNMLHGYLPGQASSALGTYQIEALKREFISFTGLILESMNTIKKPDLI